MGPVPGSGPGPRAQGHASRQPGSRKIHIGRGHARWPPYRRNRGEPDRQPVERSDLDRVAVEGDVRRFPLSTARALAPRFGGTTLFFLSSGGTGDGLWRFQDGQILEIWKGSDGALLEPPAVSKDGQRVAFIIRRNGKLVLQVENSDGNDPQTLSDAIDFLGSPDWSSDGKWIVAGARNGLFKIPVAGGAPVRLATGSLTNPVWSPLGDLILYAGPQVGLLAPLLGMTPDGTPVHCPTSSCTATANACGFCPTDEDSSTCRGQTCRRISGCST